MVMNVLEMPFYNIITHGVKEEGDENKTCHNFLAVLVTNNAKEGDGD